MAWLILLLLSSKSNHLELLPCIKTYWQPCDCVAIMGRSTSYASPSKIRRNQSRLISYLKHLVNTKRQNANLSISNQSAVSFQPVKNLSKTSTLLSNYPEPCQTCQKTECYFDVQHLFAIYKSSLSESIKSAVNEVLHKQPQKKPPDVQ